jgi:hypothetical protein
MDLRAPDSSEQGAEPDKRLYDEYTALRREDDAWQGRAISLGSFFMVVVSTTAFFLLKGGHTHTPTSSTLLLPYRPSASQP